MKNVLFSNISWEKVKYIGFDMDGTLYDEYEFVIQPYKKISKLFFNDKQVFFFLSNRWLEKGSSYNKIFGEAYKNFNEKLKDSISEEEFINQCLDIYRNFEPKLKLSQRTISLLDLFKSEYEIFLVSDGNRNLQKKKFYALKLDNFFKMENVIFTGINPEKYSKPKTNSLELLPNIIENAVFFGDRIVDEQFAKNSNMQFQKVYNMIGVF